MKRFAILGVLFAAALSITVATSDAQFLPRNRTQWVPVTPTCPYGTDANGNCLAAPPATTTTTFAPKSAPTVPITTPPTAGRTTTSMRSTLFCEYVQIKLAAELRKKGKTFSEAHAMAHSLSHEMIKAAADNVKVPATVIGDGSFLQIIIAFFEGPMGQSILNALMQFLLSLLGV